MKWLHRRRTADVPTEGEAAARKALRKADQRVREASENNSEVTEVVHTLRRYGERNNFADMVHKALGGT